MMGSGPNLGICFSDKQLYFAIEDNKTPMRLKRIGCFDFNFNVANAIQTQQKDYFKGVYDLIGRLRKDYDFQQIRMLTIPDTECWSTLPKLVYDQPDERESYLKILMKGVNRQSLEPLWFELSNRDYKFLVIRNRTTISGYQRLTEHAPSADFCSDFEIGERWVKHSKAKGSFLTVSCYPGMLSISAYLLGKLRAATFIHFDDFVDISYLWMHYAKNLKWLNGLYEDILVYGVNTHQVINELKSIWENSANIIKLDTLEKMQVSADETIYSFNLESAFPAIMLALEH
jgi:hypothetical protein